MSVSIINWQPGTEPLGSAVVAIGVFDGVHVGHQALLRHTVADAAARGAHSVAVTFDRDPDQVVSPETAAPQLLTLADKLAAMSRCGVDAILVVPFTSQLAELTPESFLDSVLLAALAPVAVHVGSDFRFGKMATGDVSTLQRVGALRGFDVVPHHLITADGEAITSTRIRGLVAAGKIADATRLLGGHPCVAGTVHRGRGEGAGLGYPTANVVPVEFAALPGDGVYAGRATLADASSWAAAISVGTPPMFPEAKDHLEAHLIDFAGDLYDQTITLEFWERLRDLQGYRTLDALKSAIAADVDRSLEIAGFTGAAPADWLPVASRAFDTLAAGAEAEAARRGPASELSEDDPSYVDDPAALEAAEQAARNYRKFEPDEARADEAWIHVLADMPFDKQRFRAIDGALDSASIEHVWEPYAPEEAPLMRRGIYDLERFSVSVPESEVESAKTLLASLRDDGERS
ncbi:MAG TPA: riboflavin biosynthesis protein RibF [Coriobacteriia bacterium]